MSANSSEITRVFIDEIWHTVRKLEPVSFGLPLPQGLVQNAGDLALTMDDLEIPLQTRCLSRWPDGSVRWALMDFQADLDLRRPLELVVCSDPDHEHGPTQGLQIEDAGKQIEVDTGAVSVLLPRNVSDTIARIRKDRFALDVGLQIKEERWGELRVGERSLRIAAHGPLSAEVVAEAACFAGEEHILDVRLRLVCAAGKAYVRAYVTILSRDTDLNVAELRIAIRPKETGTPTLKAYTQMKRARVGDGELLYNFRVDARTDPIWYEDSPEPCWVLWENGDAGVMASVRNADHNFPVRLAAVPEGLHLDLRRESEEPFHMYPWMAKSYEILLSPVEPDKTGYELTLDSALFQRPVRPYCSPEYYSRCQAFGDIFPTSRKYAGFEALISTSLRERPRGTGAMHYGDEPNMGYTYDERGHGELVWTNGEYDTPRMLLMQYARTSNRAWFEAAEAAAIHWMDIDFLRSSPNPRWAGGICCHEGDHRVAAYAGPSHEWCEGLIDYYHLTGREEALETALSVGDNVCRYIEDGEFDRIGTYALRELGWGLTAIASCLRATNDTRFRDTGLRAVSILKRWVGEFGGLKDVHRYVEPEAPDEMMPLTVQRDAFISLTLNGLNRFYLASGEMEAYELFMDEVKAQLEWFRSPEGWAEQRETKIPNLEAFAYGYRYTGERDFLEAGLQILEYALSNCILRYYNMNHTIEDRTRNHPSTYRLPEVHAINSQILGLALIPMFSFLEMAEEAGILESALGGNYFTGGPNGSAK